MNKTFDGQATVTVRPTKITDFLLLFLKQLHWIATLCHRWLWISQLARLLSVNEPTIEVPGMTRIKIKLLSSFCRGFAKVKSSRSESIFSINRIKTHIKHREVTGEEV